MCISICKVVGIKDLSLNGKDRLHIVFRYLKNNPFSLSKIILLCLLKYCCNNTKQFHYKLFVYICVKNNCKQLSLKKCMHVCVFMCCIDTKYVNLVFKFIARDRTLLFTNLIRFLMLWETGVESTMDRWEAIFVFLLISLFMSEDIYELKISAIYCAKNVFQLRTRYEIKITWLDVEFICTHYFINTAFLNVASSSLLSQSQTSIL